MSVQLNLGAPTTPKPLLTMEQVQDWREEVTRLEARIASDQAQVAALRKKLEAAALFMPEEIAPFVDVVTTPTSSSLYDAIVLAIRNASPEPLSPKAIRAAIQRGPDASLMGSENYLYTAIKRVAGRGDIVKRDNGYVLAQL